MKVSPLGSYWEYYGAGSSRRKADYSKCAACVPDPNIRTGEKQCSRNRGHGEYQEYCAQHAKLYGAFRL